MSTPCPQRAYFHLHQLLPLLGQTRSPLEGEAKSSFSCLSDAGDGPEPRVKLRIGPF